MIISGDDAVGMGAQRFAVFTGAGKRREWPPELKVSIVAQCCRGAGVNRPGFTGSRRVWRGRNDQGGAN